MPVEMSILATFYGLSVGYLVGLLISKAMVFGCRASAQLMAAVRGKAWGPSRIRHYPGVSA